MPDMKFVKTMRIEESDVKELDPALLRIGMTGAPQAAEVEGQCGDLEWAACPWCNGANRIAAPTRPTTALPETIVNTAPGAPGAQSPWYRCGGCGGAYGTEK